MANNAIYFPFINPVKVFDTAEPSLVKYYTKHFDDWQFKDRIYRWYQREDYKQVWQTSDIIYFQFISTFDPIIVELIDRHGRAFITLPALIKIPHKLIPGAFAFEVAMSLGSGVPTGCYQIRITAGASGPLQRIFKGAFMYIYDGQLPETLLLEYRNTRFHQDVIFETGIVYQFRVPGNFGFLEPVRKDELYFDQKYNPTIVKSITARQWPVNYGDEHGLPDDIVDLLNRIWSCDTVSIDGKYFCIADGTKMEFVVVEKYPKRGVKMVVEEGLNRNSKFVAIDVDANKRLLMSVFPESKVFGDLANQGSSNTVPIFNVE